MSSFSCQTVLDWVSGVHGSKHARDCNVKPFQSGRPLCTVDDLWGNKPEAIESSQTCCLSQGFLSEEEYLEIPVITKQSAGVYECSASNEVSTDIKKVQVIVNFPPYISDAKNLGVAVGQKGILRCEAIAVPTAAFEWYIEDRRIFNGLNGIQIQNKGRLSMLTFFNVSEEDYGNYTCMATNKLGNVTTSLILYDLGAAQDGKSSGTGIHASAYLLMILCVQLLLKF
ncbi:UNVERIFIED_CONTAM: hypothetical protein FKN15_059574 [Acipenser sinensis]